MAEKFTIARPYAKAVFERALADGSLEQWDRILQILALIASDPKAAALLGNPWVNDQRLLALFVHITEKSAPELPATFQPPLKNFVAALIAEKRLGVLPEILNSYQRLMAAQRKLKEVTVISAYPLSDERRKNMTAALTRYLHSEVVIDFKEDIALIGGAVIRTGHWVMDGSIKGKLQHLRDSLAE